MNKRIGTLVPMTSLYSLKNIEKDKGTFAAGLIFLDWLKKTNQSAWQMLPLHETQLEGNLLDKHIPSPYKSYGIGLNPQYLSAAYDHKQPTNKQKGLFLEENRDWLMDYALFCSLRDSFQTDDWRKWDEDIRLRTESALIYWKEKLIKSIDYYVIEQWKLDQSYALLRAKARTLGVTLIGDLSFYISVQSPLVWTYQNVFQIEKDGSMPSVSGIPDINNTNFGRQIWGHPLYNWKSLDHSERLITLWKTRIHYQARLFDYIRFDHANGFFHYGIVNIKNAKKDRYTKGPGLAIFEELIDYSRQQGLKVFVEDSGENIQPLLRSIKRKKIPRIKVLLFSFGESPDIINRRIAQVSNYSYETIAYTSTHDTRTLLGFLDNLSSKQKKILADTVGISYCSDNKEFATALRTAILDSPAQMVIIPIQDWILITERINVPGTEQKVNDPNWDFKLKIPIENLSIL